MAEAPEQAIPEALLREADKLMLHSLGKRFETNVNALAAALLAAELRGREAQKEADARIAEREIIGIFFDGDRQEELSRARDARNGTARRIATTIRNS